MLKRFLMTAICLLPLLAGVGANEVRGDEKSAAIMAKVSHQFKSYGDYTVMFTVSSRGMEDIAGEYTVSGDKFLIEVGGQKQFSDGVARYEIYPADKEVVIDNINLNNRNILTNPTRAFDFAPDEFDGRYEGQKKHGGVNCDVIELTPKSSAYGTGTIFLYVRVGTAEPAAIVYNYDGQEIDITINMILTMTSPDPALFTFNAADYPGFEIIDFR